MLRLLLLALALPLAAHAQTPCPTTCAAFVSPADLRRFNQSTDFTAAVYVDDASQNPNRRTDPNARMAGCIGGELRGVASAQQLGGQSFYFLSVAGDPNERDAPITLHYCSAQDGDLVASLAPASNADNTPTFEAGTSYGSTTIPYRTQARAEDLPVELVAFDAVADGNDVRLTWQTASETDNAGFWVERSDAGDPWADVGFVAGMGTTLEAQEYRYREASLRPGIHRFRLRQVDLDGASEYGPVVEVLLDVTALLTLAPVLPNPSSGPIRTHFTTARSSHVRVSLYDMLGRHIAQMFWGSAAAGQIHSITYDDVLPPGAYVIVLETRSDRKTQAFVRLR